MKDKRNHLVKSQKVREVNSKTTYGDFLATGPTDQFGNPLESANANPDTLFESDGFYYEDPEAKEIRAEKLLVVLEGCRKLLTEMEMTVVSQLAEGKTQQEIAGALGKSRVAVQQALIRAQTKIRKYAIKRGV